MALRFRRGSESDRTNPAFVPEDGEPVWIVDTKRLYIGDGSTAGGILVTGSSGGGGGTPGIDDNTTGVVLTLDDAVSTFTNDVELDSSDLILAGSAITGTGNINILGNITASATITGNIANIGSLNVTAGINAGSIIAAPFFDGDLKGSVFGDDSTLIVDGINSTINATSVATSAIKIVNDIIEFLPNTASVNSQNFRIKSTDNRSILKLTRNSDTDISGDNAEHGGIFFERSDTSGDRTTALILGTNNNIFMSSAGATTFAESTFITLDNSGNFGVGTFTPISKLDIRGNAVISGTLTAGAMLLSGSNIDTSDSSAITVTPGVTFNSDVTVENDLIVNNKLTVDTLEVANFTTAGSGTPELSSDTDILLTAGTRVEITQSPLKMASFTTTERNALTPQNGDVIYNTTDSKFQGYAGGTWVNLH